MEGKLGARIGSSADGGEEAAVIAVAGWSE